MEISSDQQFLNINPVNENQIGTFNLVIRLNDDQPLYSDYDFTIIVTNTSTNTNMNTSTLANTNTTTKIPPIILRKMLPVDQKIHLNEISRYLLPPVFDMNGQQVLAVDLSHLDWVRYEN